MDPSSPEPDHTPAIRQPSAEESRKADRTSDLLIAVISSNLFGLVLGGLYEYLALRGVLAVGLSRVVLVFVWLLATAFAFVILEMKGSKTPIRSTCLCSVIIAPMLVLVEVLTPVPTIAEPFPWLSLRGTIGDNAPTASLGVYVREFPTKDFFHLPLSSLYNLHMLVSTPVAVSFKRDGFNTCTVGELTVPEWNNGTNGLRTELAVVPTSPKVLLLINASARNGNWGGYAVLENKNGGTRIEEHLRGSISSGVVMSVSEIVDGDSPPERSSSPFPEITLQSLVNAGVPVRELIGSDLQSLCPKGYQWRITVQARAGIPVTTEHNLGK